MQNLIVCAFPGTGKTTASRSRDVEDIESSSYHWRLDPDTMRYEKSQDWPTNYIEAILKADQNEYNKTLLVSTHAEVIDELLMRKMQIIIVVPEKTLQNEYMVRYLRRGSQPSFLYGMYQNWDRFLREIETAAAMGDDLVPIIRLGAGQYLSDILPGCY